MRSVFREMRRRRFYETSREKTEAIGRRHKRVRKQAIRDELIVAPVRSFGSESHL